MACCFLLFVPCDRRGSVQSSKPIKQPPGSTLPNGRRNPINGADLIMCFCERTLTCFGAQNMDPAVDDGTCTASQTECSSSVSCNDALDPAWLDMEAKNQGMDISATTFETSDLFPVGLSFGDDAAFPSLEAMDLDATLGMQSDLTTPFAQLGSPSVIPQPLSHSPKSPSTDVTEPSAGGAGAVWAAAPPPSDSLDMALDMLSGATKPPSAAMMRSWPPVPATPGASSGSQMLYASALPQPPAQPMPKATFLPFLVTPSPPESAWSVFGVRLCDATWYQGVPWSPQH